MLGGLISLVVGLIGAIVGIVGAIVGLVVGVVVPIVVGILVPLAILGLPFLIIVVFLKAVRTGSRSCASRAHGRGHARMMHEINRGLERMEQRLDSVETVMSGDDRRWYATR